MLCLHNLDKHVCKQSRFAWGNSRWGNAFLDIRPQYFLQFYFQRYEYDPSMLDFHLSKLLKILLKIQAQQATHLCQDSEAPAEYYLFLMICGKKEYLVFFNI